MGILLTIAYDGTDYCGWQVQKNGMSVQQAIESAVRQIFKSKFAILGASRTDAGVHALGQRAHLTTQSPCPVPMEKLPQVINGHLPGDIRVCAAVLVPDGFHPINDAKSKTYVYRINNKKYSNPLTRRYATFVHQPLDVAKMARAARHFIGEHDFAAFCAAGSSVKTTVRSIYALDVEKSGETIDITVNGNGFLYNMVRIIAGTLVDVGLGKICADDIAAIIASQNRASAGKTMPPQGLTLIEIFY